MFGDVQDIKQKIDNLKKKKIEIATKKLIFLIFATCFDEITLTERIEQ
jgi:hypothetical protein